MQDCKRKIGSRRNNYTGEIETPPVYHEVRKSAFSHTPSSKTSENRSFQENWQACQMAKFHGSPSRAHH